MSENSGRADAGRGEPANVASASDATVERSSTSVQEAGNRAEPDWEASAEGVVVDEVSEAPERVDSLMQDVKKRILVLDVLARSEGLASMTAPTPASSKYTSKAYSPAALGAQSPAPRLTDSSIVPRKQLRVRFRVAVMCAVTTAVLLACIGMYAPLKHFTLLLQVRTFTVYRRGFSEQGRIIEGLTLDAARRAHSAILRTTGTIVHRGVIEPVHRAVDVLWGSMRTHHFMDPHWDGRRYIEKTALAQRSILELVDQWHWGTARSESLFVGFETDEFAGASLVAPGVAQFHDAADGDLYSWISNASSLAVTMANRTGLTKKPFRPTARPWYAVQTRFAEDAQKLPGGAASAPAKGAWSEVYPFVDGTLGLTWTFPLAYCGDYSCFDGTIAADITLDAISRGCAQAWSDLREVLSAPTFSFDIGHNNSSVFVVNQVTPFGIHAGVLVGASWRNALIAGSLTRAVDSPHVLVAAAARALLARFGAWNATALQVHTQSFSFVDDDASRGELQSCDVAASSGAVDGCIRVGTHSVALDGGTRWLVVLASPAGAFTMLAASTAQAVTARFDEMDADLQATVNNVRLSAAAVFVVMTAVAVFLGFALSHSVAAPLRHLSRLMRDLGSLDFAHDSPVGSELFRGKRAWISDVSELQDAFQRLSRGIEIFARFVPEAVVRNIVRGDERATRLHVSRREVTIMFSDIAGFTSISESLSQRDLLFVLTRYLSIMTQIVEAYEGVVAEILGDGLLVFWNTPSTVEQHEAKACTAALAMQQALGPLNVELASLGLPSLAVRIGLHSGPVLSGNIGSEMKMKFGCMGDPVNLASRLEGLCKVYGVSVICSGAVCEKLPPETGFICRRLDLVQVRGKSQPTMVFEVMGQDSQAAAKEASAVVVRDAFRCSTKHLKECRSSGAEVQRKMNRLAQEENDETRPTRGGSEDSLSFCSAPTTPHQTPTATCRQRQLAKSYEDALEAFQASDFLAASTKLEALLSEHPGDGPASRLQDLAWQRSAAEDSMGADPQSNSSPALVTVMLDK